MNDPQDSARLADLVASRYLVKPVGFLSLVTDITGHRATEDGLRITEERLRLALEGARMGTWHWDMVANEAIWSDMCCVLFGVPPGTPSSWDRFIASIHPRYREAAERAARQALDEHSGYSRPWRRSGHGWERIAPIKDAGGSCESPWRSPSAARTASPAP